MQKLISSRFSLFKALTSSFYNTKRTFLTESYYCYEKWDQFLSSETMKSVGSINAYSADLDQKIFNKMLVTPIDMDLLSAKIVFINNFQELEFIENIFLNFRKTQAALYVRDSMHYSFVRSYIDLNQTERLLQLLKLKYKYGLHVDSYSANILMDTLVKNNDYERAALAAHEVMLQEFNDNPITLAASLFVCFKNLYGNKNLDLIPSKQESDQNDKPVKLLVYFLRKPYNDEHFDLDNMKLLSAKTILFAVSNLNLANQVLANSLKVFGLLMFEKHDKAIQIFEKIILEDKAQLGTFLIEEFQSVSERLSQDGNKENEEFLNKWKDMKQSCEKECKKQLVNIDVANELETHLKETVKTHTGSQIEMQHSLFTKWTSEQSSELKQQIKNFQIDLKKAELLKRIDELEKQEEILTYFDKKQAIANAYSEKGFVEENPAEIPIEPEESEFKQKFERHFKPWPKYANRPASSLATSDERKDLLESLRKIYLQNSKAQTDTDIRFK